MYNYKFLFFALVFTLSINGQNSWQQNANYKIYIDVDVKKIHLKVAKRFYILTTLQIH
ncbi:MAG: hypothetical protein CM15mP102_20050 [Flavobacteriales bacterium]|nr:MAG: hypothetical protein CM15mP102_20050 [Flavobacteriales bacterium]